MKIQLTENQSYDVDELQSQLPNELFISGHGMAALTIHGDIDTAAQTIINDHINLMTRAERQASIETAAYIKTIETALQRKLDEEAIKAGYDSIHTAVTYAGETAVTKFSDDGKSFRKWRSNVWAYAYDQLALYQAGTIAAPTVTDMVAGMPARV